jgi:hypothetical protein
MKPVLAVIGVLTLASACITREARAECTDWTVAILLESDGGLEKPLENDVRELTNATQPAAPCVNIVVQFNRGGQVERRRREWNEVPIPRLDASVPLTRKALDKYWPRVRKEDSDKWDRLWVDGALSNFALETIREYPAQNLTLIVGSHGDATRAGSEDVASSESASTVANDGVRALGSAAHPLHNSQLGTELRELVSRLPKGVSLRTLGFDACQMAALEAQYEVALAVPSAADLRVVASQDNQGGPGWFYERWVPSLKGVKDGPGFAGVILGHAKDAWLQWSTETQTYGTLAHVKTANIVAAANAMDRVGKALTAEARSASLEASVIAAVSRARCACRSFPGQDESNARLVDASCFADRLSTDTTLSSELRTPAKEAVSKLESAVDATVCSRDAEEKCGRGLSVFLPPPRSKLSGYDKANVKRAPRFVQHEDGSAGDWAEWVRFWAPRATTCPEL